MWVTFCPRDGSACLPEQAGSLACPRRRCAREHHRGKSPGPRKFMLETQAPARRHRKGTRNEAAPAAPERQLGLRAPRRALVPRPALVGRLTASTDPVLAVVIAPAGYGKSTLLAEWAEHDQRTFVRVDLDERHAGSTELTVGAIIAGFGAAGLIQPETSTALTSLLSLGPSAVLSAMLGCICDQRSFVIALDDAHVLPPARSREVVGAILKDLPEGSLLALASRTELALPVARLRAQRRLVEIRTGDLAMTPADAASLLRKAQIEARVRGRSGARAADRRLACRDLPGRAVTA